MANGKSALSKTNPRESTKAKLREFADLYRGGPDDIRGKPGRCYANMNPNTSKKGCEARGSEYLNHPYTQAYLKKQTDKVTESADITQERILKELAALAFFDVRKLFNDDGSPSQSASLTKKQPDPLSGWMP